MYSFVVIALILLGACVTLTAIGVAGYSYCSFRWIDKQGSHNTFKDKTKTFALACAVGGVAGLLFPYVWWRAFRFMSECH
jgi:hypothetical protein